MADFDGKKRGIEREEISKEAEGTAEAAAAEPE